MIQQGGKQIHKENRQHDTLGKCRMIVLVRMKVPVNPADQGGAVALMALVALVDQEGPVGPVDLVGANSEKFSFKSFLRYHP